MGQHSECGALGISGSRFFHHHATVKPAPGPRHDDAAREVDGSEEERVVPAPHPVSGLGLGFVSATGRGENLRT